jgi:hypothetical protein
MTTRKCHSPSLSLAAAIAAFLALCAPALGAEARSPLPPSDYGVQPVCAPAALGEASCLALELVPLTPAARAHSHPLGMTVTPAVGMRGAGEVCETPTAAEGCFGLRPIDLHDAYELPETSTSTQTIALVDAYNDPTAASDLEAYEHEFGLSGCEHCFKQYNQNGEQDNPPFPTTTNELENHRHGSASEAKEAEAAEGWTVEMSLDIETARAICENCKIDLVEANSASVADLEAAEQAAVSAGAPEISNSWGGTECVVVSGKHDCLEEDKEAFDHPGTVITASAGDNGYENWDSSYKGFPEFPSSSTHVVAVGGTRLLLGEGDTRSSETVWNDGGKEGETLDGYGAGGGGCSYQFTAPLWQQKLSDWSSVGCASHRAVADVAADADPYTGVAVYDTSSGGCKSEATEHWCTIGGTSLASPLIASVFALAGGSHGVEFPAHTLYENEVASPGSLYDVTDGSNGECDLPFDDETGQARCTTAAESSASCSSHLSCEAHGGYDGPTGVGTPAGLTAFEPPVGGVTEEEETESKEGGGKGRGSTTRGASESSAPPPPSGSGDQGLLTELGGSPAPAAPSAPHTIRLSGLALTTKAIVAMNTSHPRLTQLSFSFTSNEQTTVRVSLQRLVSKRRHTHWQSIGSAALAAASGHNTQHLSGHRALAAGTYRLTLAPAGGAARSIEFKIG